MQLRESEYLTVNLGTFLKKTSSKVDTTTEPKKDDEVTTTIEKPVPDDFDWKGELEKRLDQNKKLAPKDQKNNSEIESQFWKEYFYAIWEPAIAEKLYGFGKNLKDALLVFGFSKKTNPILRFLLLPYVQDELIKTSLLNLTTFGAIYKSYLKKQIATTEFIKVSEYNLLYCKDLYKKSESEIITYFNLQSKILKFGKSTYTLEEQQENLKKFLPDGVKSVTEPAAILKSLKDLKSSDSDITTDDDTTKSTESGTGSVKKFITNLKAKEDLAALLLLVDYVKPGSTKKALGVLDYQGSSGELIKAMKQINLNLQKLNLQITKQNADEIIKLVLREIKEH